MKKLIYILLFVFSFANVFSQKDSLEVFTVVEEMPEFPGGMQAMLTYISNTLNYPSDAKENGIGGRVFVKFIVNENGNVISPCVLKSCGTTSLDSEAVRVVRTMPQWTPGKQNGKSVSVYFNLPLSFTVNRNDLGYYSTDDITAFVFCDSYGNVIQPSNKKFEKLPEFPGGMDSLIGFIQKNIQCNARDVKYKKRSDVFVKFSIEVTGDATKPEVLITSGSELLDAEAKRIVSLFPDWKPAIKEKEAVKTYCKMSINLNKSIKGSTQ